MTDARIEARWYAVFNTLVKEYEGFRGRTPNLEKCLYFRNLKEAREYVEDEDLDLEIRRVTIYTDGTSREEVVT